MKPPISLDVKAEVDAPATSKLVDAVVDLFLPLTEGMGYLGELVRLARIDVAANIARKAKQIADENGLRLVAPPAKFLVPFFETASLEDEGSEQLSDMWAKLLVSAGSGFSSAHILFARVLKEMTEEEADLFRRLCEVSRDGPWPNLVKLEHADVAGKLLDVSMLGWELARRSIVIKEWPAALRTQLEQPGLVLHAISIEERVGTREVVNSFVPESLGRHFNELSYSLLESLGLIRPILIANEDATADHAIDIEGWFVTHLGSAFYRACVRPT